MENSDFASAKIPVSYTKEYREHLAAKARAADEKKQAEQAEASAKPFPVDALGPILADAVKAIERKTMAPIELGASSVLASIALAAQGAGNVELRGGKIVPLSLFFVSIAKTTERKSSVDGYAMAPVGEYEEELGKVYAKLKPQYDIDQAVWKAQRNRILSSKMDADEQTSELRKLGREPFAPPRPKKTFSNMTLEGLVKTFQTYQPSLGVYSPEGANFLGGHAFTAEKKIETLSVVNKLFSGEPYSKVTIAHGEQTIADKRLSMHLMIQPNIAQVVLNDSDMEVSGFTGRTLICWPPTRIGTRIWTGETGPASTGRETTKALADYQAKALSLFRAGEVDDLGKLTPKTLTLAAGAERLALEFYNEVERAQLPRGRYAKVTGQAGRAEEQARRIAGNLELFYYPMSNQIGEHNMACGIAIARWYLEEALRIITGETLAEEVTDADDIIKWAQRGAEGVTRNANGRLQFTLRTMTQYGPGRLRPRGDNAERTRIRCRAALNFAIDAGHLYVDGTCAEAWFKGAKTGRFIFNLMGATQ